MLICGTHFLWIKIGATFHSYTQKVYFLSSKHNIFHSQARGNDTTSDMYC